MKLNRPLAALACALAACSSGAPAAGPDASTPPDAGGHVLDPEVSPSGGVADAPIDGMLHVYAVDDHTQAPLAGVAVRVGAADAEKPLTGTTDSTGLATFKDAALKGPQTVTASVTGYAPATWIGVKGANLTLPLSLLAPPAPPSATIKGTVAGWASVPAPAAGHMTVVVVVASIESLFKDSPQFQQGTQPVGPGTMPANLCVKAAGLDVCSWSLVTRPGKQFLVGVMIDKDTRGTLADDSDDVNTVTGYSFAMNLEPASGATVENVALTPVAAGDMGTATVRFVSPPAGLTEVLAFPVLDMGEQGMLPATPSKMDPVVTSVPVPKLVGSLAGGTYLFMSAAQASATDKTPAATGVVRGVTDLATTVDLPAWLTPPTALSGGATFSFTGTAGATVHVADLFDSQGKKLWSVVLLDGSAAFTLPALTPDPLPTGTLTLRVQGMEVPGVDVADFTLDLYRQKLARLAAEDAAFTR